MRCFLVKIWLSSDFLFDHFILKQKGFFNRGDAIYQNILAQHMDLAGLGDCHIGHNRAVMGARHELVENTNVAE